MKPAPENVEGRLVRSHSFEHAVHHQINWSHVLIAVVLLTIIVRFGPGIVAQLEQ